MKLAAKGEEDDNHNSQMGNAPGLWICNKCNKTQALYTDCERAKNPSSHTKTACTQCSCCN